MQKWWRRVSSLPYDLSIFGTQKPADIERNDTTMNREQEPGRVLITAGAAGIGRVLARSFLENGYRVHVCDVNPDSLAQSLAGQAGLTGSRADVGDPAQVDELFAAVRENLGGLDLLINNAGIAGPTAAVEDISTTEWRETLAVDLDGPFFCCRAAVPLLRQSDAGSIINIASNAGLFGFPFRLPYAVSKWALIGMTKTLAMELGPAKIRVNALCPGSVAGQRIEGVMQRDAAQQGVSTDEIRRLYTRQTSLRCFVEPEDVAAMALFLASPAGSRISGQAIGVDGHTEGLSNFQEY